jgi:lysine 2,3-aminomutase
VSRAQGFIGDTAGCPAGEAAVYEAGAGEAGELPQVLAYLGRHSEIRELLISGGDPLTVPDARLAELFRQIREIKPDICLRVCTRAPITEPSRLSPETIELFRQYRPLRLAVHINHPRELSPALAAEARSGLAACIKAGIPVLVQTVLLRGINDNPAVLAELFRDCVNLGLTPYYLFQLDLAPGTAHFRVPLDRGLALYRELGEQGGSLPAYAVDLPGGGGKIRLTPDSIAGESNEKGGVYFLKGPDGRLWAYPKN